MKIRPSASLTASVCTLCIAAATMTAAPSHAAAAVAPSHRAVSTVSQNYALTASTTALTPEVVADLLQVAGIPFQNFSTALTTLSATTGILALPNAVYVNLYNGEWAKIPTTVQTALDKEAAAIAAVFALPRTLVDYNVATISKLLADLGAGNALAGGKSTTLAALPSAAAATPNEIVADLLQVAGIPFQNFSTALTTLSATTGILALPNAVYVNVWNGEWAKIPATVQSALDKEAAAIAAVFALPQKLIDYNVATVSKLIADLGGINALSGGTSLAVQSFAEKTGPAAIELKPLDVDVVDIDDTGVEIGAEKHTQVTPFKSSATVDGETLQPEPVVDVPAPTPAPSVDVETPAAPVDDATPSPTDPAPQQQGGASAEEYKGRHRLDDAIAKVRERVSEQLTAHDANDAKDAKDPKDSEAAKDANEMGAKDYQGRHRADEKAADGDVKDKKDGSDSKDGKDGNEKAKDSSE